MIVAVDGDHNNDDHPIVAMAEIINIAPNPFSSYAQWWLYNTNLMVMMVSLLNL